MTSQVDHPNDELQVATLLRSAGERRLPSAEATRRAHEVALEAWQNALASHRDERRLQRRRTLMWVGAVAGAAAVIMFVGGRAVFLPRATIAEVERVVGTVEVTTGQRKLLARRTQLTEGTEVASSRGRLALRMGGLSLRVAENSRLRLDERGRITLASGALYVDSGPAGADSQHALRIATRAGEVRHAGTQFQVWVDVTSTRVGVREGSVLIVPATERGTASAGHPAIDVLAGEEVRVTSEGAVARRALAAFGADWDWVAEIAPVMNIENRSAAEFVAWIARERGWSVRFSTPAVRAAAAATVLHGSIEGLSVEETLARVAAIASLSLTVKDGILHVGFEDVASSATPGEEAQ